MSAVLDRLRRPRVTDRARESQLAGLIDERHKRAAEGNRAEVVHCSEAIASLLAIPLEAARKTEPEITPRSFKFGEPSTPEGIAALRPRRRAKVSVEPEAAMAVLALLDAVLRQQSPASDDPLRCFRNSLAEGILGADPAEPDEAPPAPVGSKRGGPVPSVFRTAGLDGGRVVGPDGLPLPGAAGSVGRAPAPARPLADEAEVEQLMAEASAGV